MADLLPTMLFAATSVPVNEDFHVGYLLAVVLLIFLNGFFVAAEFALVSVRRTRIQELADGGSKGALLVKGALDDINQYVSTAQIGITMCSLAIGFLGEPALVALLDGPLGGLGFDIENTHIVAFIIAFMIMTYSHVVVGEVAPKNWALVSSESVALFTIRFLHPLRQTFRPLIWILNGSADVLFRLLRMEAAPGLHLIHSEEELKMLVSQSSRGGVLEDSEQEMLYNVFDFADTDVAEVMVPRPDVVGFPVDMPPAELLAAIASQPFTRYPIYRGSMDEVQGILHIRDLFIAAEQHGKDRVRVDSLLRPPHLVPESKSLAGLLADFRRSKTHMALVVDEYGSLAGIVTLEDLLEEIVGEIDDEHDRPERPVERISDNHVRVDGKYSVEELNERFDLDLPKEDYHTVGGVVFGLLGQAPHEGDVVRWKDVRLEVVETDGPRIVHVDIIMRDRSSTPLHSPEVAATGSESNGASADAVREGMLPGGEGTRGVGSAGPFP